MGGVARRLVERGAHVERLWHAAALGLTGAIEQASLGVTAANAEEVTEAFWQACHGDQRAAAEYLPSAGPISTGSAMTA